MSSRGQRSIPLGGRYRQVLLYYHQCNSCSRMYIINSVRTSDAIRRHRPVSTLVDIMARYLTAPSQFMNLCIRPRAISQDRYTPQSLTTKTSFKITYNKFYSNSAQIYTCVKTILHFVAFVHFCVTWKIQIPHDDIIKWKHFRRYWPFVRGIHRSPVNSPRKGQWRGALVFSLICALSKPSWGWWFETSSRSVWRQYYP